MQFEGAMALLEEPAVDEDPTGRAASKAAAWTAEPTTARPASAMKSARIDEESRTARIEEAEELDVTPAAVAAKLLQARGASVGAEGGGEGEADGNDADDDEDYNGGDEGDSGGVVYVSAPTRLPTPP